MGTKLEELRDGCFHRALDDEPMFVILARDVAGPVLIRSWALNRRNEIIQGKRPASDYAQIEAAEKTARDMEAWRKEHDGEWRHGLFTEEECEGGPIDTAKQATPHNIRTEGDEYACICGARWDVTEGRKHP